MMTRRRMSCKRYELIDLVILFRSIALCLLPSTPSWSSPGLATTAYSTFPFALPCMLRITMLSDSNTNVNSMINRRVGLFYRYPLGASHHMVCPCTSDGVWVVCPGTSELVGQHPPPISISASENGDCQP